MAARVVRRCYSLYCSVGINVIPQHVKLKSAVFKHVNNTFMSSVGYGTRGTDSTQHEDVEQKRPKNGALRNSTGGFSSQDNPVQIPVDRLTVSYSKSSGPGGQHVNKVSTKAEVRFHVKTADWIPEDVRQKVLEKNKNRINKAGELLVTSELSRSQQRNLFDCIQKISAIIAEASEKPHEPTTEDIALRAARLEKGNKERLKQKKIHSATKQSRRVDFD